MKKTAMESMSSRLSSLASLFLFLLLFVAASCGDDNDNNNTPPVDNSPALVKLANNAKLGSYITDNKGVSLYMFALDADGQNHCTDPQCMPLWPIFYAGVDALTQDMLASGLNAADFGVITTNGKQQTTYKGYPLYYYAPDASKANTITGDGVLGIWFVGKTDYSIYLAQAQLIGQDGKHYTVNDTNVTEGDGLTVYFTDDKGRTLYAYKPDIANTNKYSTGNSANDDLWPVYTASIGSVPSVFTDKSLFTIINVPLIGKNQLAYKGHPLYYFIGDTKRGDNKGVSVPTPGVWPVVTQNITALTGTGNTVSTGTNNGGTTTTPPPSGGGGYPNY